MASGLGLTGHVSEHELDPLQLGHRLAELVPLRGVAEREVGRPLGNADRLGGDRNSRSIQCGHGDPESVSFVAEPVGGRHPHLVEVQLGGRRAADPHLMLEAGGREAGRIGFNDEGARTLAAAHCRIGQGEDDHHVGN